MIHSAFATTVTSLAALTIMSAAAFLTAEPVQAADISIDINGDGQNEVFQCDQAIRFSDTATFKWVRFQNCGSINSPGITSLQAPPIDFMYSGATFETVWSQPFGTSRILMTNLGGADSLKIAVASPTDARQAIASLQRFPIAEPSSFQGMNFQYDPAADTWLVYSNSTLNPSDAVETNHQVTLTIHDPMEMVILGDTTAELKDFGVFLRKTTSVEFFPFRGDGQDFRITSGDVLATFFLPSTGSQAKLTATADDQGGKRCREVTNTGTVPFALNVFNTQAVGPGGGDINLTPGEKTTFCPSGLGPPPANRPPTADSQSVTTDEDTAKTITLSGSDPDGDPLFFTISGTLEIVFLPEGIAVIDIKTLHGKVRMNEKTDIVNCPSTPPSLALNCMRNVRYTPDANYNGPDSFTFKTSDGVLSSTLATVTINILPVNDPPTLGANTINAFVLERENDPERLKLATIVVRDPDLDPELNLHPDALDPATGLPKEEVSLVVGPVSKDGVETQAISVALDSTVCTIQNIHVGPGGGDCEIPIRLKTPVFGTADAYGVLVAAAGRDIDPSTVIADLKAPLPSGTPPPATGRDISITIAQWEIIPAGVALITVRNNLVFPGTDTKPVQELVANVPVTAYPKDDVCNGLENVRARICNTFRINFTSDKGVAELSLAPHDYFFEAQLLDGTSKFWGPTSIVAETETKQAAQFVTVTR